MQPEMSDVLTDVFTAVSKYFINEDNLPFIDNLYPYEIYELLNRNEFVSKTITYKPQDKFYDKMWQSFKWKNPAKGFSTPKEASKVITGIYDILSPSDQLVLREFLKQQDEEFSFGHQRFDSLDPDFPDTYEIPKTIASLLPRDYVSTIEAIELAQNMVSFDKVSSSFVPRNLVVQYLNLQRCRDIKALVTPTTASTLKIQPRSNLAGI